MVSDLSKIQLSGIFGVNEQNGSTVKIDNLLPLETQAQGQDLKPEPEFLRAAGSIDREPAHPCLSEIEPPQDEAEKIDLCSETGQTKEIIAPNERPITAPMSGTHPLGSNPPRW
ncbi:hypothetical protein DSO57_1037434 [Entomophthora muscae]|uniref:Uncharacterized protein n=1 Tax=Entomophthora muscae TaxID=34485 RepID=A0ACC2S132_9FUNG|nr:hypothetical protein DSO57_1037434 [Entomophthora muscae]